MHMRDPNAARQQRMFLDALEHLQQALDLLDDACAPAQIGAHIDLAIHDLRAAIAVLPRSRASRQIDRNAAPQ